MTEGDRRVTEGSQTEGNGGEERRHRLREAIDRHLVRYAGEFMPVLVERSSGCKLFVEGGRTVLDFTSGQMCATLGHNHPAIVAAVRAALLPDGK